MIEEKKEYTIKQVIEHVERIINNLNQHWHSIELLLGHVSNPLEVNDVNLRYAIQEINEKIKINLQFVKDINLAQYFGEIKYIGKRLSNIEKILGNLVDEGMNVNIEFNKVECKPSISSKIKHK